MSTSTQNEESQNQEITPQEKCQHLIDTVADMRVRYPAYIARLNEKIAKINVSLLKNKLKAQREVKLRAPKYNIDVDLDIRNVEKLRSDFKKQKDLIHKMKTLKKMADQIKNDHIGQLLNEEIDSKTFIKRVQQRKIDKEQT